MHQAYAHFIRRPYAGQDEPLGSHLRVCWNDRSNPPVEEAERVRDKTERGGAHYPTTFDYVQDRCALLPT